MIAKLGWFYPPLLTIPAISLDYENYGMVVYLQTLLYFSRIDMPPFPVTGLAKETKSFVLSLTGFYTAGETSPMILLFLSPHRDGY